MSDEITGAQFEPALAGREIAVSSDDRLAGVLAAEASLWKAVWKWIAILTPVCIVIWLIIVALAVGPNSPGDWLPWILSGIIVGILAGGFFGGWAGFTVKAHDLDRADLPIPHHH